MPHKQTKNFFLLNLGCARNLIDSEYISASLLNAGYKKKEHPKEADIIIINSCSFIESAINESIEAVFEAINYKKEGMCEKIILVGCLPERFKEDLIKNLEEVDVFVGTAFFDKFPDIINSKKKSWFKNPNSAFLHSAEERREISTEFFAYLKIAEGCNYNCTYCIIPKLRGKQRSREIEDIKKEAEFLIQKGVKEIILVAQDTTNYGEDSYDENLKTTSSLTTNYDEDLKKTPHPTTNYNENLKKTPHPTINYDEDLKKNKTLTNLLETISKIDKKVWIRVLYGNPNSVDDSLIDILKTNQNIAPYFDLPIQHASDSILKKMGRKYSLKNLETLFNKISLNLPNAVIRTTVMTGFPTETKKDFDILINFIKERKFNFLGAFTYSNFPDLPSHNLKKKVSKKTAQKRADEIMLLQREISKEKNKKYLNKTFDVLIEKKIEKKKTNLNKVSNIVIAKKQNLYEGRTIFQAPEIDGVCFVKAKKKLTIGNFYKVKIYETFEYDIMGLVVKQ